MPWILFTDNDDTILPSYNLTLSTHFLDGSSDLHSLFYAKGPRIYRLFALLSNRMD